MGPLKQYGRTVAAIVEFHKNQILMIKRASVPFKGYWALPGGKVEPREKVEHTAVREVKEETGLDVVVFKKIGEYHESGLQDGVEYDFLPTCFVVLPVGGKIRRQKSEIEQIKVFSIKKIPRKLAFTHTEMIRDYVLARGKETKASKVGVSD